MHILGKIGLTILCVLPAVLIKYYCDDHGIILGGIPYAIIYTPIIFAIIRIWSKQKKKENEDDNQTQIVDHIQPEEMVKEEMKEEMKIKKPVHQEKQYVHIFMIVLSVVCVACITLTVITNVKLSDMNKAMIEMQNQMQVQYEQINENKIDISHLKTDVQINEDDIRNHISEYSDIDGQISEIRNMVIINSKAILQSMF